MMNSVLTLLIFYVFGVVCSVTFAWGINVTIGEPIIHKFVCGIVNHVGCNVVEERAWYRWIRVKPAYRIESTQLEKDVSIYNLWKALTEKTNCTVVLRDDVISVSGIRYKIDPSLALQNKV